MIDVAAEALVKGRGMKERINIVVAGAWTDGKVTAVGGQVGLGFIRPDGVKAFADDVLPDHVPKPASGCGIGGVDVGAGTVIGQTIHGRAIRKMLKPAILQNQVVIASTPLEARPNADHGLEAHG